MSDPFIGEIKIWAFPWAPRGWALCDGAQLNIQQNAALYSLINYQFGGDMKTVFNLPDLRGRVPVGTGHQLGGTTYKNGDKGGAETVTLNITTVPVHGHGIVAATDNGTALPPTGNLISTVVSASTATGNFSSYKGSGWTADVALNAGSVTTAGADKAHSNMQPFAVVNYCIATVGNYPPRN